MASGAGWWLPLGVSSPSSPVRFVCPLVPVPLSLIVLHFLSFRPLDVKYEPETGVKCLNLLQGCFGRSSCLCFRLNIGV